MRNAPFPLCSNASPGFGTGYKKPSGLNKILLLCEPLLTQTSSPAMSANSKIPSTQKAAVVTAPDKPLKIETAYPVKQPKDLKPGECLVQLDVTGVCHTDLHARNADWPIPAKLPLIGGHEVHILLFRSFGHMLIQWFRRALAASLQSARTPRTPR